MKWTKKNGRYRAKSADGRERYTIHRVKAGWMLQIHRGNSLRSKVHKTLKEAKEAVEPRKGPDPFSFVQKDVAIERARLRRALKDSR